MPESRFSNGDIPATRRDLAYERQLVDDKFERLDERVGRIQEDVASIRHSLSAGPRWMGARANAIVDKLLPAAIAVGALWLLSGGFH